MALHLAGPPSVRPQIQRLPAMPAWWQRQVAADRLCILITSVGLLLGSAIAGAAWYWQDGQLRDARHSLNEAVTGSALERAKADALAQSSASTPKPWWALLPPDAAAGQSSRDSLTSDAMVSASELNVRILRMSLSQPPRAEEAPYLGVAVQVELRGAYPDIKRWLGELLARRSQSLALKSMDLRRAAEGTAQPGVEASIELRLFERSAR